MSEYKKLQNGSDIRGIAIDGIDGEKPNLTPKEANHIAAGFAKWLREKTGREDVTIAVGRDPRVSGPDLLEGLLQGFCKEGIQVFDAGLASTPAMFMATIFENVRAGGACEGSIMITASHLPFNRNGFKFFTKDGGLDKKDIARILELAEEDAAKGAGECDPMPAQVTDLALMDAYCVHLQQVIRTGVTDGSTGAPDVAAAKKAAEKPLAGMKIVVDAGNGSGGFLQKKCWLRWGRISQEASFWSRMACFRTMRPIRKTGKQWNRSPHRS